MRCGGQRPDWRPCEHDATRLVVAAELVVLLCRRCAARATEVPDVVVRPLVERPARRPA